ncbi:hypothetical protein Pfo_012206 [Paulownia fortunei]|nr:hypothetical protein Pfo_012206 [Paulownia fortunei]
MADAIVSTALQRLADIIEKQIGEEKFGERTIRNVLDDAERRGYKEKSIQQWLKKLQDTSYGIDDVLDEWNFAILKLKIERSKKFVVPRLKVCSFIPCSCLCFKKVATRQRLDMVVKEKDQYDFIVGQPVDPPESDRVRSTSSLDVSEIHGREADKDFLVSKLMIESVGQEEIGPHAISIVGTGGIGKTTLAQLVYIDARVINCFKLRIWVYVSNVFDEVRIAKGIVEIVKGTLFQGKRFFLVMDDVWTEDYTKWEPLKNSLKYGGPGSKILVTTRSERVARMIHYLGQLSDIDCWSLMQRIAFFGRSEEDCEELQDIGKNIANKCKGLPLAAKVMGSLLQCLGIWQLEEVEVDIFPHLLLSYNELSPAMKRCFSYCGIFPKDSKIDVEKLIRMWMAQGYLSSSGREGDLELRGKEYFDNLRMRSFFVNYDGDTCKMHDIVHDFVQFLRKTKSQDLEDHVSRVEARKKGLSQACDPSLVSHVKVYRSLCCRKELLPSDIIDCTCLRVLSLCECGLQEIPIYMENLIHLRYLDLTGNRLIEQVPQTICKLYILETLYLSYCGLKEVRREIGNLIHLRHLDLSWNGYVKELPEAICNLHDLRTLDLAYCASLCKLPEGLHKLVHLRHIPNDYTHILHQIPQGLEQLTGLRTLRLFHAGRGWSNGSIELKISLHDREDVTEAQKAELRNKIHIQCLKIWLINQMGRADEEELTRNEAMEALQLPPNLRRLTILDYQGTKFPGWITSSLNHLRILQIQECNYCTTLPLLGKLPGLEELSVWIMRKFKLLDREFLGIAGGIHASMPSSAEVIGFPKLKKLSFWNCPSWKDWEDITAEEAGSATMSIFPCLRELKIDYCGLTELPHRLLPKASSIEHLTIQDSINLSKRYEDENGSGWRSLSHIPHVEVDYLHERAFYRSYETPLPVFYG